ncbi:hypothetical protein BCR35DRAFT_302103 [Leucosporidium creatinivorum]|uniref:Uncharacterized protein n=1 Tax=Leucosporidium creatinivorum TaxID=106004 RepID=A0A1Y2FZW6_9BASI|nr:hypothetical protein BCR35DRAFT_302103 [Leucosporidium creatinivorum]
MHILHHHHPSTPVEVPAETSEAGSGARSSSSTSWTHPHAFVAMTSTLKHMNIVSSTRHRSPLHFNPSPSRPRPHRGVSSATRLATVSRVSYPPTPTPPPSRSVSIEPSPPSPPSSPPPLSIPQQARKIYETRYYLIKHPTPPSRRTWTSSVSLATLAPALEEAEGEERRAERRARKRAHSQPTMVQECRVM